MVHERAARSAASRTAVREALPVLHPDAVRDGADIRVVRAPGRVNLIGEHTDYNEGLVLPAAIDLEIAIAYVPTDDDRVELVLLADGERGSIDLTDIGERSGRWTDYVAGTAWAMREAGVPIRGFRGVLGSTIPTGSGLSSSAALELASAWALSGDEPPPIEPMRLALTAQRAENAYVGVMCGLMDQFASTMGIAGSALRLDCRSLDWRPVPIPAEVDLVVCHSGSPRRLEASAYNARRAECARAVAVIAEREPGVAALRDVDEAMLERYREHLDDVAYRRALHVVSEDRRVLETEAALRAHDLAAVGRLFAESHDSLRDLFEVSSPALDALVEIARSVPTVIAARLTGAGFGGCTINLVERGRGADLERAVLTQYPERTGLVPRVFVVDAAEGAGVAA